MEDEQLAGKGQLVAELKVLVLEARRIGLDPEIVAQLDMVARQAEGFLREYADLEGYDAAPERQSVQDFGELQDRLSDLNTLARGVGVPGEMTDYLRTTQLRLAQIHHRPEQEKRLSARFREEVPGTLYPYGSAEGASVEVVDRSAMGFGILTSFPMAVGDVVRLEIHWEEEPEIYICGIIHSEPLDDGYRLGLDMFSELQ